MTFWDFLDKDGAAALIAVGITMVVFAPTIGLFVAFLFEHRQKMARIKAGQLDGEKIAKVAKEYLQ